MKTNNTVKHTILPDDTKKKKSKLRKSAKMAIPLLLLLLIAEVAKNVRAEESKITEFEADIYEADVGEYIKFSWETNSKYSTALINYGDGTIDVVAPSEETPLKNSIEHAFETEGTYAVLLTIYNGGYSYEEYESS